MKANELEPLVKTQEAIIALLQKQFDAMDATLKQADREISSLRVHIGKIEERLANHIAQVEKWDARRWAITGAIIGGLAINIVMLFINRK